MFEMKIQIWKTKIVMNEKIHAFDFFVQINNTISETRSIVELWAKRAIVG